MFIQFNSHTLGSTSTSASDADWQKWEKALSEIHKILEARISYNKELQAFFGTASPEEVTAFLKDCVHDVSLRLVNHKKIMTEDVGKQIEFYESIKKIISERPHNQEMIDELHFLLNYEHEKTKAFQKTESFLTEKGAEVLQEGAFFAEGLSYVKSLISAVELDYTSSFKPHWFTEKGKVKYAIVENPDQPTPLPVKYEILNRKILALYEAQKQIHASGKDVLKGSLKFLKKQLDALDKMISKYANVNVKNQQSFWRQYRDMYQDYCDALETFEETSDYIKQFSENTNTDPKKEETAEALRAAEKKKLKNRKKREQQKKSKSLKKKTVVEDENSLHLGSLKSDFLVSVEPPEHKMLPFEQAPEETKNEAELFKLKTIAWKEEVEKRKLEKKRVVDDKHTVEHLRFETQKKRTEDLLATKKEDEYKNACELLANLNSKNRALIEQMFDVQTPHCKIRYQEIESLFGEATDGKLPGTITSVSGSHRKICIQQNTIGFFDEFYVAEANTEQQATQESAASVENKAKNEEEVAGGMFKAHKSGQGCGKLPRAAIKMVCATLERVGITADNIARVNQSASQKPKPALRVS
jgi:hypothetical protein